MTGLRLIFMGTPGFALASLRALVESQHEVVTVYTQPPRAAGRGMDAKNSPVQRYAEEHKIPVLTPESFMDEKDVEVFKGLNAGLAVVAAYGLILPESILNAPKFGCINIHASLLPRWRGASPIQQAILHGDKESGISIMQMERGLDTGPVLMSKSFTLDARETASSLHDKLADLAGRMIVPAVDGIESGELVPQLQDDSEATLAPKIKKAEGEIDWTSSAEAIDRKVRAFGSALGTWFMFEGKRIRILEGEAVVTSGNPGHVLDDQLIIGCGEGAYRIKRLQREGKKAMTVEEFLRGSAIDKGTNLTK